MNFEIEEEEQEAENSEIVDSENEDGEEDIEIPYKRSHKTPVKANKPVTFEALIVNTIEESKKVGLEM